MYIERIELQNFRNYESSTFAFDPQGLLIIGPNGSGKTNLLEAIAYCGIGKSIRFHHDEQLLRFDTQNFSIQAKFRLDLDIGLLVNLSYGDKKKLLRLDTNPIKQLSALLDTVKVIYCAPEDLILIGGIPKYRRQYFDLATAQIFPEYIAVLRKYLHIVEQRNALLKRAFDAKEKDSWDLRFCEAYIEVLQYRMKYLQLFNDIIREDELQIETYKQELRYMYALKNSSEQVPELSTLISYAKRVEEREKYYQRSIFGAHVDDYEFLFNDKSLKLYGSQGQKRINVIILKLAQATLIKRNTGIKPILLFDDIFAELDNSHAKSICKICNQEYQILIASPKSDIRNIWNSMPFKYLAHQEGL